MQSQEYRDTLFTEAVVGFTATGVFLPEESTRVSCVRVAIRVSCVRVAIRVAIRVSCFADLSYTRRREFSMSADSSGRWARGSTFLGRLASSPRATYSSARRPGGWSPTFCLTCLKTLGSKLSLNFSRSLSRLTLSLSLSVRLLKVEFSYDPHFI